MNYWWVNLGATHETALDQGFLWSPKTNKNGNETYDTYAVMKDVSVGDIVIANVKGNLVAKGLVIRSAYDSVKPRDFEDDPNHAYWNRDGYRIDVDFEEFGVPQNIQEHIKYRKEELESIREKYFPISKSGKAREAYLCPVSKELWDFLDMDEEFYYHQEENAYHVEIIEETLKLNIEKGPMHYRDITEYAINSGLLTDYGSTPERSFNRSLNANLDSRFNSHGGGFFSLKGSYSSIPQDENSLSLKNYSKPQTLDDLKSDKLVESGASKRKKAYNTHNEMENEIFKVLKEKGCDVFKIATGPNVDLCWKYQDKFSFLEVKSVNKGNFSHQIRMGIGQVIEYRERFNKLNTKVLNTYLAITSEDSTGRWEEICKSVDIVLITPKKIREIV